MSEQQQPKMWSNIPYKPKFRDLIERENQIQSSELLSMAEPANWSNKIMYDYLEIIYNDISLLYTTTIEFGNASTDSNNHCFMFNTHLVHRHSNDWLYCLIIPANINKGASNTRHSAVAKYMVYFCESSQIASSSRLFLGRLEKLLMGNQQRNPSFGLTKEHVMSLPSLSTPIPPVCLFSKESVQSVMFCSNVPVCFEDVQGLPIPPKLFNYLEKIIRDQLDVSIRHAVDMAQKHFGHALLAYSISDKLNHVELSRFPMETNFSLLLELSLEVAPRGEDHCAIRLRYQSPSDSFKLGCYRICSILSLDEAFLSVRILSQPPKGSWLERRLGLSSRSPPSPSSSITAQDSFSSTPSFQQSGGSSNYSVYEDSQVSNLKKQMKRSRSNSYSFSPPRFSSSPPPSSSTTTTTTTLDASSTPLVNPPLLPSHSSVLNESLPPSSSVPPPQTTTTTASTSDGFLSHRSSNEDDWEISQNDDWASDSSHTSEPSLSWTSSLAAPTMNARRQRSHSLHSPLVRRTNLSAFAPPPYFLNSDIVQPASSSSSSSTFKPDHHHPPPPSSSSSSRPSQSFSLPIMISPPPSSSSSSTTTTTTTTSPSSSSSHLEQQPTGKPSLSSSLSSLSSPQRLAVESTNHIPADDPIWAYRKWQLLEMYQKIHKDYPKSPELFDSSLREEIVFHILNSNWKWKCELCCRFNKSDPKRSHCRFKKTPWKCYFAHGNDDLRQKKKYF